MYTQHGHHIPGTPILDYDMHLSRKINLCGGIEICAQCMEDVKTALKEN